MIKIIKHGRKPTQITCSNPDCGCIFTFETEDVRKVELQDWYGGTGKYRKVVNCPECRWALDVPENKEGTLK